MVRRALTLGLCCLIASGSVFAGAAAGDGTDGRTVIEIPPHEGPLPIFAGSAARGRPAAEGHSFTFSWTTHCGAPARGAQLKRIVLIERPKTAERPYKSALIYAMADFPAKFREVDVQGIPYQTICTAEYSAASATVGTKRPARKLIYFDGGTNPPRRLWPPVGVHPKPKLRWDFHLGTKFTE